MGDKPPTATRAYGQVRPKYLGIVSPSLRKYPHTRPVNVKFKTIKPIFFENRQRHLVLWNPHLHKIIIEIPDTVL
jgi:hypothetical protein